jgi:peptidoglycan/LPS O-acetylase OafA/YrhL
MERSTRQRDRGSLARVATAERTGTEQQASGKFAFLDGLRGWAAMWVVVNHLQHFLDNALDSIPWVIREYLIIQGGMGVVFFFALSGFVITRSLASRPVDTPTLGNFYARRLARLTPPYYAALVFTLVVNVASVTLKHQSFTEEYGAMTPLRVITNLAYIPTLFDVDLMINGIYWTLYVEMQFYALIGLLCWAMFQLERRNQRRVFDALIVVLCLVSLIYPAGDLLQSFSPYIVPYLCCFMAGVLVYWHSVGRVRKEALAIYFAALLACAIAYRAATYVSTTAAMALLYVAATRTGAMQRWLSDRVSHFLGQISFSLYLIHPSVLGAVYYVGERVIGDSAAAQFVLIIPEVAACVLAAMVMHRFVEQPAINWSSRLKPAPQPPQLST